MLSLSFLIKFFALLKYICSTFTKFVTKFKTQALFSFILTIKSQETRNITSKNHLQKNNLTLLFTYLFLNFDFKSKKIKQNKNSCKIY